MIRVDRGRPDLRSEDRSPIRPSARWLEAARQATGKAVAEGRGHQVSNLYRHPEVRIALEALFHDKCAYCEGRPTSVGPWDVEHFRPKGGVEERPGHPGYYWLAYTWANLYPACVFCNRRRRDAPRWEDPAISPAAGKGCQFPLEDEATRAMSPEDDLKRELPLLLDPCSSDDDPEKHFIYDSQGQIHPRDPDDRRARTTIDVFHLQRRRLRNERARILVQVVKHLEVLRLARARHVDEVVVEGLEQLLAAFLADDAPYAGVARAVIRDPETF